MMGLYCLILGISAVISCTPKIIINVEGYPAPQEVKVAWSADRSISLRWFFARQYPKKIISQGFSEYIDYPEYLSPDKMNNLSSNTKAVIINLIVSNPYRKKYRLVKFATVGNKTKEEPLGSWTIREYNHLLVFGPLAPGENVKLAVRLLIEDPKAEIMLSTDELHYQIAEGEESN
jgi:hypothetical protein